MAALRAQHAGTVPRERLELGMPAPEPAFSAPIQGLPEVTLQALRGRPVVLEFWATWCGPCIPALRHVDELRTKLAGQPIEFVGVALDTPERVRKFVEHTPFGMTLVCDPDGDYYRRFGLHAVPGTVILDAEGRIAAITRPDKVDLAVLQRVIAGQPPGLPRDDSVGANVDWAPAVDAEGLETWASVVIAPADPRTVSGGSMHKPGSGRISGDGLYRSNLLQLAYDVPHTRLVDGFGAWQQSDPRYRVRVVAPCGDDELARRMLGRSLEAKLGYRVRKEPREVPVKLMRRLTGGGSLAVHDAAAGGAARTFAASGRGTRGVGQPLDQLRQVCENAARKPVVDETGLDPGAAYDWQLEWVDARTFHEALATVGLELVDATRSLEFVVVEPGAAGAAAGR